MKHFICVLLFLTLAGAAFSAEEVHMPAKSLQVLVRSILEMQPNEPITEERMLELREIHVKVYPIGDLTGLEHALNLRVLILSSCDISDITPLSNLPRLEHLNLGANPLVDISPLAGLVTLKTLHLHKCEVIDITPIASLTQLTTLVLLENNISDFTPLEHLTQLERLDIRVNPGTDYDVVGGLADTEVRYDQLCELAPYDLESRRTTRTFPSIFNAWGRITNREFDEIHENYAQHDLMWGDVSFQMRPKITGSGIWMAGDVQAAIAHRGVFTEINPNMLFLLEIRLVTFPTWWFPKSWPHWLRDSEGNWLEGSGRAKVDFAHPEVQRYVVQRALAVERCGLYDGIFLDHGSETYNPLEGHRTFDQALAAKESILQAIRAEARDDFLIITNSGKSTLPRTGQYINGLFMETGTPIALLDHELDPEGMDDALNTIRNTLNWGAEHLRQPNVICLEGGAFRKYDPGDPINLQYMRLFTTLSLTHSDGYVLFTDGFPGHKHYWYNFWDADLGVPVGEKGQLYQETDGLYVREFTNGWAVYNHSGAAQTIRLHEDVVGVASRLEGKEHTLPNLDGEMYLRVTVKIPADVNGDGVVNVFDLILVAQAISSGQGEADVNGDGLVNVFDLVMVANEF